MAREMAERLLQALNRAERLYGDGTVPIAPIPGSVDGEGQPSESGNGD